MNTVAHQLADLGSKSRFSDLVDDTYRGQLADLEARLCASHGVEPSASICTELFSAGGKRMRPLASLSVSRMMRLEVEKALDLAEAVELTHGATLLHDDVIDEADYRRGMTAARKSWSNTLSVLSGDFLLVRALRLVERVELPAVKTAYLDTLDDLLSGEVAQHSALINEDISVSGYLRIASGKTGSLLAFACSSPAIAANDEVSASHLWRFGEHGGIAFQIADDIRDLLGYDPSKPAGLDLADGVLSLPLRLAGQRDESLRRALLDAGRSDPEQIDALATRVRQTDAVLEAIAKGRAFLTTAIDALNQLRGGYELYPLRAFTRWIDSELHRQEAVA